MFVRDSGDIYIYINIFEKAITLTLTGFNFGRIKPLKLHLWLLIILIVKNSFDPLKVV